MKKLLLLLTLLSLLLLAGCDGAEPAGAPADTPGPDPQAPVSLVIWHYYNGPQKNTFDALIAEFNETVGLEQGIVIEAFSQGNVNDLIANVMDAVNHKVGAGDVPDIFAAYPDTAYAVDKLGLVANLEDYLSAAELAEYRAEFLEEGRIGADGGLKIFPIAKSLEQTMVNLTDWQAFSAATGAQLSELETVEGISRVAEAYYLWTDSLTEEPEDGKALFGRDALANYFVIGCRQLGVEIFGSENGEARIDADREALYQIWQQYYVPYINGYIGAYGRFRSDDIKTGALISCVGSSSSIVYFPEEVSVSDLESYPIACYVMPAPRFANGEAYAVQQGAGMVVTKSTPEQEYAATVFLKWFTETDRNIQFSVGAGYLPVKNEALDLEKIYAALEAEGPSASTELLKLSFAAALEQIATHTLYTTKAFDGGTQARYIAEDSLTERCEADRAAVLELMAGGLPREEAVAEFVTEAHFQTWYEDLVEQLNQL